MQALSRIADRVAASVKEACERGLSDEEVMRLYQALARVEVLAVESGRASISGVIQPSRKHK